MLEKRSMSPALKTILSIICFMVVLAALLVVVTIDQGALDLKVSQILTKNSIRPAEGTGHGDYISRNGFALFFEAIGSAPFYLTIVVAGCIFFWAFARKANKKWRIVSGISAVAIVVGFYLLFSDLFKYVAEYIGAELERNSSMYVLEAHEIVGAVYVSALSGLVAAVCALGSIVLWSRIDSEINDRMVWWGIALLGTLVFYLVIDRVKSPIGRARYRAMNFMGDFSYYTPWYQANGKRIMVEQGGIYSFIGKAEAEELGLTAVVAGDTCKSFPSGHTFSASMVYGLLALPYLTPKCNKKGVKVALWCVTIAYTAIVAISRVVAGAHYMSDVLFGGTIGFLASMLMREIFVCKGSHFFALFPKHNKSAKQVEAVEAEESSATALEE